MNHCNTTSNLTARYRCIDGELSAILLCSAHSCPRGKFGFKRLLKSNTFRILHDMPGAMRDRTTKRNNLRPQLEKGKTTKGADPSDDWLKDKWHQLLDAHYECDHPGSATCLEDALLMITAGAVQITCLGAKKKDRDEPRNLSELEKHVIKQWYDRKDKELVGERGESYINERSLSVLASTYHAQNKLAHQDTNKAVPDGFKDQNSGGRGLTSKQRLAATCKDEEDPRFPEAAAKRFRRWKSGGNNYIEGDIATMAARYDRDAAEYNRKLNEEYANRMKHAVENFKQAVVERGREGWRVVVGSLEKGLAGPWHSDEANAKRDLQKVTSCDSGLKIAKQLWLLGGNQELGIIKHRKQVWEPGGQQKWEHKHAHLLDPAWQPSEKRKMAILDFIVRGEVIQCKGNDSPCSMPRNREGRAATTKPVHKQI